MDAEASSANGVFRWFSRVMNPDVNKMRRLRILVLSFRVPATNSEKSPRHFFQELQALTAVGCDLRVLAPEVTQIQLKNVSFGSWRTPISWSVVFHLVRHPQMSLRAITLLLGVRSCRDFRGWVKMLLANIAVYREISRFGADVVHSHWAEPYGSAGWLAAKLSGVPLVMTMRGYEHIVDPATGYGASLDGFYRATLRAALKSSARITVCCSDSVKRIADLGVNAKDKIIHVFHAVDADRFSVASPSRRSTAKIPGRFIVTCVAMMLDRRKGHDIMLDAFRSFLVDYPEAVLVLVGDGPLRSDLGARAAALGIEERVEFVGQVHSDHIPNYLYRSSFTILPTRAEVFGNVVFESLLAGIPVISSDCGAARDVLKSCEFGLLFRVGDSEDLLRCMLKMAASIDRMAANAASGSEFVRRNMSLPARASQFRAIYESLIPRFGSPT